MISDPIYISWKLDELKYSITIGKKLIKETQVKIHISHTEKKCIKCNNCFIYKHSDDAEKLERLLCWNKSGNLDLCLDCDK